MLITHLVDSVDAAGPPSRNSIGGTPILPTGMALPVCTCGEQMLLFFQFDIKDSFGLPYKPESHFSVFMCPSHNDIPASFHVEQLPPDYWKKRASGGDPQFYELVLHPPGSEQVHEPSRFLKVQRLVFTPQNEEFEEATVEVHPDYPGVSLSIDEQIGEEIDGKRGFKVGGQPAWAQEAEVHKCCCGAAMRFLCQVPLDHPFPKLADAPEQPDTFSSNDYSLFLGNAVYLFACEEQCNPYAVHVVVQN